VTVELAVGDADLSSVTDTVLVTTDEAVLLLDMSVSTEGVIVWLTGSLLVVVTALTTPVVTTSETLVDREDGVSGETVVVLI